MKSLKESPFQLGLKRIADNKKNNNNSAWWGLDSSSPTTFFMLPTLPRGGRHAG